MGQAFTMAAFPRHAAARFPVPWLTTIGLFAIWGMVCLVFACLIALAIEGIGMYAVISWVEVRMTGWAHRSGFNR